MERKAGFLAAHEEHFLADAGADRIDRNERPADRLALRRQAAAREQRDADEVLVLAGHDDVADDPGQLHGLVR